MAATSVSLLVPAGSVLAGPIREATGVPNPQWQPKAKGLEMEGKNFDQLIKRLGAGSSRRRVLAGLGLATAAALVGRAATATPSTVVECKKACNATAKEDRKACAVAHVPGTGAKNACLKEANATRKACRVSCAPEEPTV